MGFEEVLIIGIASDYLFTSEEVEKLIIYNSFVRVDFKTGKAECKRKYISCETILTMEMDKESSDGIKIMVNEGATI